MIDCIITNESLYLRLSSAHALGFGADSTIASLGDFFDCIVLINLYIEINKNIIIYSNLIYV